MSYCLSIKVLTYFINLELLVLLNLNNQLVKNILPSLDFMVLSTMRSALKKLLVLLLAVYSKSHQKSLPLKESSESELFMNLSYFNMIMKKDLVSSELHVRLALI